MLVTAMLCKVRPGFDYRVRYGSDWFGSVWYCIARLSLRGTVRFGGALHGYCGRAGRGVARYGEVYVVMQGADLYGVATERPGKAGLDDVRLGR